VTLPLPPSITDAQRELLEERAAILEFDAGMGRNEAEFKALLMVTRGSPLTQAVLEFDAKEKSRQRSER
jgi:hypothetical protein